MKKIIISFVFIILLIVLILKFLDNYPKIYLNTVCNFKTTISSSEIDKIFDITLFNDVYIQKGTFNFGKDYKNKLKRGIDYVEINDIIYRKNNTIILNNNSNNFNCSQLEKIDLIKITDKKIFIIDFANGKNLAFQY